MTHSSRSYLTVEDNLTSEDIRYLRPTDLALITRIDASNFSAWMHRRKISERILEQIAQALRTDKTEVLRGFELRREDIQLAQAARAKAKRLLCDSVDQEPA